MEKRNPWRDAVEDALITHWVQLRDDPKESVDALLRIVQIMALDPRISKDAEELIQQGIRLQRQAQAAYETTGDTPAWSSLSEEQQAPWIAKVRNGANRDEAVD